MEGSARDRFRLIYLKSTEPEKPVVNEPVHPENSRQRVASNPSYPTAGTFSSQTQLEQAKTDLKHPDPQLRKLAIDYLEKVDPSVASPLLQETLSDRIPDVRARAVLALVKLKDPGISPLLRKYLKDSSPKVKIAALRGIFQFREGVDLNILLQLMSDESPWVRRKMATLLGWTPIEGVLPILVELSKDPDGKVRKAALFSLIALYPEESEEQLIKAMADPDSHLRKWAKKTLEKRIENPIFNREQPGFSSNREGGLEKINL
jgi:HEAT repeat protein